MRFPGFIGGSNSPQALTLDSERTVNLVVERSGSPAAANAAALLSTPGFRRWSAVTDVGWRGFAVAGAKLYAVYGVGVWVLDSSGAATRIGTVVSDANPALMVYNGSVAGQVGISSGGNIYSIDVATNNLTGPYLVGRGTQIQFASGYGLAFDINTGRTYVSGLNDFTSWDLANYFARSAFPDPAMGIIVDSNALVWHFGTETFEVRDITGTGSQPFEPLSGLLGLGGLASTFGCSVGRHGLTWLARYPQGGADIVTTRGSSAPTPVTPYAMNTLLEGARRSSTINDTEALIYHDQGHTATCFTLPTANQTIAYDHESQTWAERGLWDSATGRYGLWAPRGHVDFMGKHLVGDRTTGTIWEMSDAFATDIDGRGIRRLRRTAGLLEGHKRIPISQIEIIADVGLGNAVDPGVDPQMTMRISEDGGRTWSAERRASMGRAGEYRRRITFQQLGAPAHAVLECVWSDPTPVRIVDCTVNEFERAA